jgi:hypothetical protein
MLTQQSASGGQTITLADGSAISPSLNFINDLNTGIFHSGTANDHILRFTNGGLETIDITPTGIVPVADNTLTLGLSGIQMQNVFTRGISSANSNLILTSNTGSIIISSASGVLPTGDGVIPLGNASTRWQSVSTLQLSAGSSNLTLSGTNVIPAANNTMSLGLSGSSWSNIYTNAITNISGNLNINVSGYGAVPPADNTATLGASGNNWANVFTYGITASGPITLNASGSAVVPNGNATTNLGASGANWAGVFTNNINTVSGNLTLSGSAVVPAADNTSYLGLSGDAWANVFTHGINAGGNNLTITASGLIPATTSNINIGGASNRWHDAYVDNIYATGYTTNPVFENGTLSGQLIATGITGTITYNGVWYRVNNIVNTMGTIGWTSVSSGAGTGSLAISNGVPPQYRPIITAVPASVSYVGLSGITTPLQLTCDVSISGQLDFNTTSNTGMTNPVSPTAMNSTGTIVYSITYATNMLL